MILIYLSYGTVYGHTSSTTSPSVQIRSREEKEDILKGGSSNNKANQQLQQQLQQQQPPRKRLVLFAGPHSSGGTSVEQFFYEYARGDVSAKQNAKTFPLRYWKWPRVNLTMVPPEVAATILDDENSSFDIQTEPYKIFNLLVTQAGNGPVQEFLLKTIQQAWDTSAAGIIVGSEAFDKGTDGLAAMQRIVKRLKIPSPNDVTIIINYRTPRFEQWQSIWSHDVTTKNHTSYQDWLCADYDDDSAVTKKNNNKKIVPLLQTQMNPLRMMKLIFTQQKKYQWQISLMDMKGIEESNLHVSHIIACQIMHAKCTHDNTWVRQHDHTTQQNDDDSVYNDDDNDEDDDDDNVKDDDKILDNNKSSATGLTEQDQELAEDLFRFRDCGLLYEYKSIIVKRQKKQNDDGGDTAALSSSTTSIDQIPTMEDLKLLGITVYHQSALWDECHPEMSHVYNKVQNPDVMYKALLSQTDCGQQRLKASDDQNNGNGGGGNPMTIGDVLSGTYQPNNDTTNNNTKGTESWHQLILEAILYPMILISALVYQVCRMYRGNLGRRRYQKVAISDDEEGEHNGHDGYENDDFGGALLEAEMTELRPSMNANLNAEYGEISFEDENDDDEDLEDLEDDDNDLDDEDDDLEDKDNQWQGSDDTNGERNDTVDVERHEKSVEKKKYEVDMDDDDDDDEFMDALESQSSLETGSMR